METRSSVRAIPRLVLATFALAATVPSGTSAQMTPPPAFLVTAPSSHDFDETVALLKQAIEGENLMVVNEVNPQQMLRMVGVRSGGMRQIFFFHPRFMKAIIETNRNGGIEAPLKVLVMERPDGKVMVRYHDPEHLFAPYDGLGDIATELKGITERVVAAVR
jgi:uncharacterized protein (DUF302 family)